MFPSLIYPGAVLPHAIFPLESFSSSPASLLPVSGTSPRTKASSSKNGIGDERNENSYRRRPVWKMIPIFGGIRRWVSGLPGDQISPHPVDDHAPHFRSLLMSTIE